MAIRKYYCSHLMYTYLFKSTADSRFYHTSFLETSHILRSQIWSLLSSYGPKLQWIDLVMY